MKLSTAEQEALELLKRHGGCISSGTVSDRTEPDVFGNIVPGIKIFKSLEKKGLIFFTEEEPIVLEDGTKIDLTPLIYLEEENADNHTTNR